MTYTSFRKFRNSVRDMKTADYTVCLEATPKQIVAVYYRTAADGAVFVTDCGREYCGMDTFDTEHASDLITAFAL